MRLGEELSPIQTFRGKEGYCECVMFSLPVEELKIAETKQNKTKNILQCCMQACGLQGPGTPGRQAGAERDLDGQRLMEPRHDSVQGPPFIKRVCL